MSSTTDLSETIPHRFDFSEAEPRLYAQWESAGCFASDVDRTKTPYTIVIPPPNVTGALHLGHGLNNTLQDVLIRWKRMQGFNALWMPGTDHAGIATQAVVEKRLFENEQKTRHDLGREALVARIWSWKDEYERRILGQLKQLGASCDWRRTRFTLDPVCAAAVRRTFFDLFKKSWIYRGKRLVNWDTHLQTAVSDDELVPITVKGHFWSIRYDVIDPKPGELDHVVVATTRPETMLGDTAVAVHPEPTAQLKRISHDLQTRLADASAKERPDIERQLTEVRRRQTEELPRLETLAAMAREGRTIMLPLMDRPIPLVADTWAKPELGSGCVKITPAHDTNDYEVGRRHNLPMINLLNPDGTLGEAAGPYAGLKIKQARTRLTADLEAMGRLVSVEDREIELPHSDRSKTPIEPYLADQWFVRMKDLAQSAIDAVRDGRVSITPSRYAEGYVSWLAEKRDWPVSRQLWWGHQIPVWSRACTEREELDALLERIYTHHAIKSGRAAVQVERPGQHHDAHVIEAGQPIGVVHVCLAEETLDDDLGRHLESLGLIREQDVLDTWFSSALWPHSTLGWPERTADLDYYYPTNTLITSRDIITLWVARMVLMGLNNVGEVPFRDVYIHPKILDGFGETMSKSKGNGIDPLDVIRKFGADALRFGMVNLATETQDVRLPVQFECPHCESLIDQTKQNREQPVVTCPKCGKLFSTQWAATAEDKTHARAGVVSERFEVCRNFTNKLWNAARLVLLNLDQFSAAEITTDDLTVQDRWMLSRLQTVTHEVTDHLGAFRYADASRAIYSFAWDEFCSLYLELIKDRLSDASRKTVASRVLVHALDQLLRLLHPMMPFVTEEIWQLLGRIAPVRALEYRNNKLGPAAPAGCFLMQASWPVAEAALIDTDVEQRFGRFREIVGGLREIRSRQNLPPRQEIEFSLTCDAALASELEAMTSDYLALANAKPVAIGPDVTAPPTAATVSRVGIDVHVDLKDFIDVPAEILRNQKRREQLLGLITGKEKKLTNGNFVSRAPADVVAGERASLQDYQDELIRVDAALVDLAARK